MPRGPRRLLRLSCKVTAAAAVLFIVCIVLRSQVPVSWRPRPPLTLDSFQPYVNAQGRLVYLQQHVMLMPIGTQIETGLRVRFSTSERVMSRDPDDGLQTREQAQAVLLRDARDRCLSSRFPEAAPLVESAGKSPRETLTVTRSVRRLAAALLAAEPYVSSIAELALGVAVPLVLYALYRIARVRRRRAANLCPRCRYNLAGLQRDTLCPECNLDTAAYRFKAARRVGLLRVVMGWAVITAAVAVAGACVWTFSPRDVPIQVSSVVNPSSEPLKAGFVMGGVYVRRDLADLRRAFPVAPTMPPWAPEAVSTQRWAATWHTLGPLQRCYWFALWPLVPVLGAAGIWIRWCGLNANRRARTAVDSASRRPAPVLTPRQFLTRWGALAAGFASLLALPLLASQQELHIRDFTRDSSGTLFPGYDYANGGAEAKLSRAVRNSPLLLLTRDNFAWFPQPPRPDELAVAIGRDPSMMNQDVLTTDDLARPSGVRWSVRLQAGVLVAPLCAMLLVHPLSAAAHHAAGRRSRRPNPSPVRTNP